MTRFKIRGAGLLDMPLRVLDLMAQHGVAVSRATIAQNGQEYCIEIEGSARRVVQIAEKIRAMILVQTVEVGGDDGETGLGEGGCEDILRDCPRHSVAPSCSPVTVTPGP